MISLFKNRSFLYLWIAQGLSQLANNVLLFFITFFIYKKTNSNIAISIVLLVYLLPSFISSILAGVIVDRMGKKWILFFTMLLRAFFVFLMFFSAHNVMYLYIFICLLALTTQFFTPAESSIMPKLVPRDKLIEANAYFASTINLSLIGGFLLSSFLFKFFGFNTLFFIFGAYMVSTVILYFLPTKEKIFYTNFKQPLIALIKKFSIHLSLVIKDFVRDKTINRCVFSIVFLQVVFFILIASSPGFADKILKIPVEDLSFLIIFPIALGFIAASGMVNTIERAYKDVDVSRLFFILCGSFFLLIFIISQFHSRSFFNFLNFIFFAGFGFSSGMIMIVSYANLQKATGEERRAGYFGLLNALINIVSAIPVFFSGIVSDVFGVDKIVIVLAIVFFIVSFRMQKNNSSDRV